MRTPIHQALHRLISQGEWEGIMKFSVVALLFFYVIATWESISCNGSRKIGIEGTGEVGINTLIPHNHHIFSRMLLETKDMSDKSGLKGREVKLQESKKVESGLVEEKQKEKLSETEEESSEMESELTLTEESDDSEPEITEGQKKARETEQQVEQIEKQITEPMIEKKELKKDVKRIPEEDSEKVKLEPDLREGTSDLEAIKKERIAETNLKESSKSEAEKKIDSELAVNQKVLDEEVKARANWKRAENKTVVNLQMERESEKHKQGRKKGKKGTDDSNIQSSSVGRSKESDQVTEDTRGGKMQHELESGIEGKGIESELVSLQVEGSEDGTMADVAIKVKKNGKKVSDSWPESESESMEGKRWDDMVEVKLQKTAENNPGLEKQINSEKGISKLNQKTIKENKPRQETKGRQKSKSKTQVLEEEIKLKVLKSDGTMLDLQTKPKKGGQKVLDSISKSELVEAVKDVNKKAEKKLENEAEETLDAESKEKETQSKSIMELRQASHNKTKGKTSGKVTEGEEISEVELQVLSEGNELKEADLVKEISDAEKDEAKHYKSQGEELKEMNERSNVDEETPEQVPSKKIQEKEPREKRKGEEKSEVDLQATKEEQEVQDINDGSKEVQQSDTVKGKVRPLAQDSADDDDDEYGDFMQDFTDLPSKFQDTAHKLAGHFGPNIQKITDTSKVYFNKANLQITESFSPLVGKQYAPFLASMISYGLLLLPLAIVIILFEHIRALLSLQKVILFVNIYLAAYFATLLLATFIIGSEPMTFFYKNSTSSYLHLQLLQGLGYIVYLVLLTFDVFGSCSSETLPVKIIAVLQWFVADMVGLHYYVTVFHRAMSMKGPHTSWKIYGMYSIAFSILSLFARINRTKKEYTQPGDVNTDKKN